MTSYRKTLCCSVLVMAAIVLSVPLSAVHADSADKRAVTLPRSPVKTRTATPVKTVPAGPTPVKPAPTAAPVILPLVNTTVKQPEFFMVTSPGTGTRWRRTTIQTIEWMQPEAMDDRPTVKLVHDSFQHTVSYHTAEYHAAEKRYSVRLRVPGDVPVGSRCRVIITGYTNGTPRTCESGFFTIEPNRIHSIQMETPNGGERWHYGSTPTVVWRVDGEIDTRTRWEVDLVKGGRRLVTYPQESLHALMVHPETGRCSFQWAVVSSLEPGDDYEMVVRAAGTRVEDRSDRPFSVTGRREGVDLWVTTFNRIGSLEPEGGEAEPGWRFNVDYTVYNSGSTPAPPFEVAVYLSGNTGLSPDDTLLTTVTHRESPAGRECIYIGGTFVTVPAHIPTGRRYYVIFQVDWNSRVGEYNERNNISTHPAGGRYHPPPSFFLRAPASQRRDLRADAIRISPLSAAPGATHRLHWNYTRTDYVFPAPAYSFPVRIIMSDDFPSTPDVEIYAGIQNIPARPGGMNSLGGGRYIDFSFPEPVPGLPAARTFHFRMILDETNQVHELDETNNTAVLDYRTGG